jgi:hypothetical protein
MKFGVLPSPKGTMCVSRGVVEVEEDNMFWKNAFIVDQIVFSAVFDSSETFPGRNCIDREKTADEVLAACSTMFNHVQPCAHYPGWILDFHLF